MPAAGMQPRAKRRPALQRHGPSAIIDGNHSTPSMVGCAHSTEQEIKPPRLAVARQTRGLPFSFDQGRLRMRKLILTATSIALTAAMMALPTSAQAERRNPNRINWCSKTEGKVDCK